jgi:hypothetical protein
LKLKLLTTVALALAVLAANVVPASAGAVGGPQFGRYRLQAFSSRRVSINFYGNHVAGILIHGAGHADLDMLVYDEFGNLVAKDDDSTDGCYVEWTPRWTGRYTLCILNHGPVHSEFEIVTN